MAIAAVITREVRAQDVSQPTLGAQVGISQPMMSFHLRGKRVLDVDPLAAICTALGLTIVDVVMAADLVSSHPRQGSKFP